MKRSALPLPRYVLRKPIKSGGGRITSTCRSGRARRAARSERAARHRIEAAVQRAETVLLPAFDSWRWRQHRTQVADLARPGTLDWVFADTAPTAAYTKLDVRTRRNHEVGFRLVGGYVMKDGRRLGTVSSPPSPRR